MKKLILILLILSMIPFCALAEGGAEVEVIRMDGVSVVVFTPEETMLRANAMAIAIGTPADIVLPRSLTIIGEEAFMGIAAADIEVTENVVAIEARAFSACPNLQSITIPAKVLSIDDSAIDAGAEVTIYGAADSEAERFATANGFTFIDLSTLPPAPEPPEPPVIPAQAPPVLPFVPRR